MEQPRPRRLLPRRRHRDHASLPGQARDDGHRSHDGEVRDKRSDPDATMHVEGGGNAAYGNKFVFLSARTPYLCCQSTDAARSSFVTRIEMICPSTPG